MSPPLPPHAAAFDLSRWTRRARASWVATAFPVLVALAAVASLTSACKDPARDAARNESETVLRDQAALEQVINHDLELDKVMQEADEAVVHNEPARAIALLESRAVHDADVTVAAANASSVATAWGRTQREALVAFVTDRKNEIPRYAAALKAGDLGAKLDAIQAQVALQRRAMALQAAIAGGPDAAAPAPVPAKAAVPPDARAM